MSDEAWNVRNTVRLVGRHKIVVGALILAGLLAGAGYGIHKPPMLTSSALVVLPAATRDMPTEVVIAGSSPVLVAAERAGHLHVPLDVLQGRVKAKSLTSNIISISSEGTTAAQAEDTANAVAQSFIGYFDASNKTAGAGAQILERATSADGTSLTTHVLVTALVGVLAGALVGPIVALALGRRDRRLRERGAIADALGVPVLASIEVCHPADPADWTKVIEQYQPRAIEVWRLRTALDHLGLTMPSAAPLTSIAVLSLAFDKRAMALGPQLAVCAAELGIRTALVFGAQQDAESTATLRAACVALSPQRWRSGRLQVAVRDHGSVPVAIDADLTIVVAVLDERTPDATIPEPTSETVIGVSAGAVTADQLARVAASAAASGRDVAGILVADPDPADRTTGRVPQLARPLERTMPTRVPSRRAQMAIREEAG